MSSLSSSVPSPNALSWIFLLFTLCNGLLAYSPLSLVMKTAIGLGGILIPFLYLLSKSYAGIFKPVETKRSSPGFFSHWTPALIFVLALCLRFYHLTSFSGWPSFDDGWLGAYALDFYEKWNWRILFGFEKSTALYPWAEVLIFKIIGPSLTSLWFLPAFLSFLTVPLLYFTCRHVYSENLALLCGLMSAVGFWPLL